MKEYSLEIADALLQINAIQLSPQKPFTWASGLLSPIYCDNRKTLSYPGIRNLIRDAFVENIQKCDPKADFIAGVATAGIPQAAIIANQMELPLIYVRSKPKAHGQKNLVEGAPPKEGSNVVVIEDLISTGQSALHAVNALREIGTKVANVYSIFTYGLSASETAFGEAECQLHSLCDYDTLISRALEKEAIRPEEYHLLRKWRKDPNNWNKT